ncbi:hypothetical protein SeMB42_g07416 [Synchytrium endobioticum]|uniref:Extracellular membrane protein CFEM domain-containing protein n=1 Tax=Synchytrium endobioticum TaxID=286115 RepID=A0A507C8S8_9FUNG|nr:hypothetical protein SeMB42_g07416 [Synchytrium endobioticum]TPX40881.1 hypothetical protein SeLEV6574_g06363 [Synchytrium endobioticum]
MRTLLYPSAVLGFLVLTTPHTTSAGSSCKVPKTGTPESIQWFNPVCADAADAAKAYGDIRACCFPHDRLDNGGAMAYVDSTDARASRCFVNSAGKPPLEQCLAGKCSVVTYTPSADPDSYAAAAAGAGGAWMYPVCQAEDPLTHALTPDTENIKQCCAANGSLPAGAVMAYVVKKEAGLSRCILNGLAKGVLEGCLAKTSCHGLTGYLPSTSPDEYEHGGKTHGKQ